MTPTQQAPFVAGMRRHGISAACQSTDFVLIQKFVPKLVSYLLDFALLIAGRCAGRVLLYSNGHGVRQKFLPATIEGYVLGIIASRPVSPDHKVEIGDLRQIPDASAFTRLTFNAAGRGRIVLWHGQHQLIVDPKDGTRRTRA